MALIYLVDDSRMHLNSYGKTLTERGYKIKTFERARGLLDALEDEVPDLIVSDIVMPEMDGVRLCAEIRKRFPKEVLPLLLVSSLDTMEDMVRGYEAGADDYLVKPVRTPEFHAKVSLLLRQKRGQSPASGGNEGGAASAAPARVIDRYEILDSIGEGAFGTVFKARRLGCEDIIALKVLSQAKLSQRSIARFLRETEILKSLGQLEGISRIVDVGFDGEHYFYAMELIPGASIKQLLADQGPLPERVGIRVALDVTKVLKSLAECEIVHRDIKPANIIVSSDGRPTLIDFGLAKLTEGSNVTQRHELPGTPAYIPPEAIRGVAVDVRGDIYSLGITVFEMLTNRLPFEGASSLFMLVNIAEGTPPNLEPLIDANVSPALSAVLERMIANNPEDRYQTPDELIADLAPLC